MNRKGGLIGLLVAVVLLSLSQAVLPSTFPSFPAYGRPPLARFSLQDMAFVLLGMRRLGADVAFMQLLQYYGTADNQNPNHPLERSRFHRPAPRVADHDHDHDHDAHGHSGSEWSGHLVEKPSGEFPYLNLYTFRTVQLNPLFHYAYLFTGGALAFNLHRDSEALDILAAGSRADPHYWKFRTYAGAIAFKKKLEYEKVISLLEDGLNDPECPSLLKNILANIYRQRKDFKNAARVYVNILEKSRDREYVELATRRLREMGFHVPG